MTICIIRELMLWARHMESRIMVQAVNGDCTLSFLYMDILFQCCTQCFFLSIIVFIYKWKTLFAIISFVCLMFPKQWYLSSLFLMILATKSRMLSLSVLSHLHYSMRIGSCSDEANHIKSYIVTNLFWKTNQTSVQKRYYKTDVMSESNVIAESPAKATLFRSFSFRKFHFSLICCHKLRHTL